jgi:hypothetical protein
VIYLTRRSPVKSIQTQLIEQHRAPRTDTGIAT